jgi:hypothetical protein
MRMLYAQLFSAKRRPYLASPSLLRREYCWNIITFALVFRLSYGPLLSVLSRCVCGSRDKYGVISCCGRRPGELTRVLDG